MHMLSTIYTHDTKGVTIDILRNLIYSKYNIDTSYTQYRKRQNGKDYNFY